MKLSTFTIIKNEAEFVGYGIMSVLEHVDEMIFADGNSEDGTIEIIEYIQKKYDKDKKIKLFKDKDCKNLRADYVRLFNWTLKQCTGDYVWFLHPDMICQNPSVIKESVDGTAIRYSVNMVSLAGNRDLIIAEGRDAKWATIYKNSLGLHYWGWYGHNDEDLYFKEITGDEHHYWKNFAVKPYVVKDTNIILHHYCDTKPYDRRYNRMVKILFNNGFNMNDAKGIAQIHPRVSLESGMFGRAKFDIQPSTIKQSEVFKRYGKEFERFRV